MERRCDTCEFWVKHAAHLQHFPDSGECHAEPPTRDGWPATHHDDWCRHWSLSLGGPPTVPLLLEIERAGYLKAQRRTSGTKRKIEARVQECLDKMARGMTVQEVARVSWLLGNKVNGDSGDSPAVMAGKILAMRKGESHERGDERGAAAPPG